MANVIESSKLSYVIRFLLFGIGLNDIHQCFYRLYRAITVAITISVLASTD